MLTTRADLLSAVITWLDRSDLSAQAEDFLALAEASIQRRLRTRFDVVRTTITVPAGEEAYTLPDAARVLRSIAHVTEDDYTPVLKVVSPERLRWYSANYGATGIPRMVAVVDGQLLFAPVPDAEYTYEIVYDEALTPLVNATDSNAVLLKAPDLYLYATLLEAAVYQADDARIALFKERVETALYELETEKNDSEFSPNTLTMRPRRAL